MERTTYCPVSRGSAELAKDFVRTASKENGSPLRVTNDSYTEAATRIATREQIDPDELEEVYGHLEHAALTDVALFSLASSRLLENEHIPADQHLAIIRDSRQAAIAVGRSLGSGLRDYLQAIVDKNTHLQDLCLLQSDGRATVTFTETGWKAIKSLQRHPSTKTCLALYEVVDQPDANGSRQTLYDVYWTACIEYAFREEGFLDSFQPKV